MHVHEMRFRMHACEQYWCHPLETPSPGVEEGSNPPSTVLGTPPSGVEEGDLYQIVKKDGLQADMRAVVRVDSTYASPRISSDFVNTENEYSKGTLSHGVWRLRGLKKC